MSEHEFTLILASPTEVDAPLTDRLFEAGCDDATVVRRGGVILLDFSREASSAEDAVLSAIRDVTRAGCEVARLDLCELVSQAEIARRTKRTRQAIHQYVKGTRGPGGFPPPDCHINEETPLWRWCDVACWLASNGMLPEKDARDAEALQAINSMLGLAQVFKRRGDLVSQSLAEFGITPCQPCQ